LTRGQLPNLTVLVVAHAERHSKIRIISARHADKEERETYYATIGYSPRS
jgi:uncharacterized DUF497 family protein